MSMQRFAMISAVFAAVALASLSVGRCQEKGAKDDAKGKQAATEKWAGDEPSPPDRDGRMGPPDGPSQQAPPPGMGDRKGPPTDNDRMGHQPGADGHRGPGMGGPPPWFHDGWESLEKNDPEMYKLIKADMAFERETRDLVVQYRRASADERTKLKEKIKEVVGKHFDVRQQRRELELKRLEAELKRLREATERRQKAREKLIEQRLTDLLGREDEPAF